MASTWLSADRILIGIVGVIGAYAAYRLTKAEPRPLRPTPEVQNVTLPLSPGPLGAPTVALVDGDPVTLTNSRAYRGRLETLPSSSREEITEALQALGFEPGTVRVYMTPAEAAAVTPPFALQNPGQGTRWFYGRYLGPTREVRRPQGLVAMWITRGPMTAGEISPAFFALERQRRYAYQQNGKG